MKKRILCLALAAIMLLVLCPAIDLNAKAADESTGSMPGERVDVSGSGEPSEYGYIMPGFVPETVTDTGNSDKARTGEIPSSWDSRSNGVIPTSVRDQSPYGDCWAFAAMACAETDAIINHNASASGVNLSEWHLAWFAYHQSTDPLGNISNDYAVLTNPTDYLNNGGNQIYSGITLAAWRGAADEAATGTQYSVITGNSSASVSDAMAFKDTYHLENMTDLPIATAQDRTLVKQLLMEYGAADTSYFASGDISSNYGYYQTGSIYPNHEVTIVGWDDNYSRNNFISTPAGDGAWLIRNSWGSDWGNGGYFWLSYYDASLTGGYSNATFYDYGMANNYDCNY